MSRLKLQLPSSDSLGSFDIPVRITDINYGNHLSNNAVVEIVHEARVQLLASHGYTELDVAGAALIMNELAVEYKNESLYGDILQVQIFCGDITRISFELYYQITTLRDQQKLEIAIAKTKMVGYSYEKKKISPLPAALTLILSGSSSKGSKFSSFAVPG